MRIGIIGLDSTHAVEFTRVLNTGTHPSVQVVAACRGEATDFPLSVARRHGIEQSLRDELGIHIVGTSDELVKGVDAIMLLSCDGRCHAREMRRLLDARLPVFIDKPLCADWQEANGLLQAARSAGTPCFSASALRYRAALDRQKALMGDRPAQIECSVPRLSEPGHADLSWYGIHGVESAYALLGPGCLSVRRELIGGEDITTGLWADGSQVKINRTSRQLGAEFPTRVIVADEETTIRGHNYLGLLAAILRFFETRESPVSHQEMIEVLAFIAAADESRTTNGTTIDLTRMLAHVNGDSRAH